jgi:hypothetical protein
VREEQQKDPDLWMVMAGFVGSKEVTTKAVANTSPQEDCSKQTRMDSQHKVVRTEGAAPGKLKKRELDQRELQKKEISFKVWIANHSSQIMRIQCTKHPSPRRVGHIGASSTLRRIK